MRILLGRRDDHLRCRQVQKLLQSFLDGELGPDDTRRVAEHLDACERCGFDAEVLGQVKAAVASLDPGVDPEALARLQAFAESLPDEA